MKTLLSALMLAISDESKAVTFVMSSRTEKRTTYGEMYTAALKVLAYLQEAGLKEHDELIIQLEDDYLTLCSFGACLFGKIIPIPLSTSSQPEHLLKLHKVWER